MSQRMQHAASDSSKQLTKDWISLTFGSDHQRLIGPITISHLNWLFIGVVAAVAYLATGITIPLVLTVLGWLFITAVRANYVQRRRRRALTSIYETVAARAKLPTGTASNPPIPSNHIQRVRWGAKQNPKRFQMTLGSGAPAANAPLLRSEVEADIENITHALHKHGGEWHFEWDKRKVTATAVGDDDPKLSRKAYQRKLSAVVREIFAVTRANAAGWNVEIDDWETADTSDGATADYPTTIVIRCAEKDLTDHALRDKVERHFERAITTPREWIYSWDTDTSTVTAAGVAPDSLQAKRKRNERRVGDDMRALVSRAGKDPIVVAVTEWISDELDLPRALHANFGTLSLDDTRAREKVEDGFDAAVQNRWPSARALFEWHHGAVTELDVTLVADNDPLALQRTAERRLRSVVDSKFGSTKNPVTTEVLEWQPDLSPSGAMLPHTARAKFGTEHDLSKPDTRDAFQDHWDSIDNNNDWHYEWNTPEGYVEMIAVPKLADAIAFPDEGSDERELFNDLFRQGKVLIGWKKGGGQFVWNLNKVAHGIIGGTTGAGKSVLLDTILQGILSNRDIMEVVGVDIKMTDFPWMQEFPNVVSFAEMPARACQIVAETKEEMNRRKRLCNKRGVKTIGKLRELYARKPELELEDGPCPKRRFLFFDELGEFLAGSKDNDLEELLEVARADLESIGRLARAFEINIVAAAQKPEAKVVSTQLKLMMAFKVCVGSVDEYTSKQIMDSNHGTRFPPTAPKGRAWAWTSEEGFHLIQIPFLPAETELAPWDPTLTIEGSQNRLRAGLIREGWTQIQVPNEDGGQDPRWVRIEDNDVPDDADNDSGAIRTTKKLIHQTDDATTPADSPNRANVIPIGNRDHPRNAIVQEAELFWDDEDVDSD